ncbi:GH25 family lysozyme [Sphingomonas sp. RT2P30]|uniref:glycoside hydrolase family 25 protein n=1 Tax=Parasphingomonas halimpatiens TaxID=3096162 RepID=UPI002FCB6768
MRRWTRRFGRIVPLLIVIGLALVVAWSFALSWRPASANFPFQGVDVDERHGPIDWWTVRAGGADFAYVRATFGGTGRDARFAANWADIYATGMRRGALHVYSICNLAADQANNFNTTVPRVADALPAAVQIDFTKGCESRPEQHVVIDELRRFMTMVEQHTGKPVLMKLTRRFDAAYQVSAAIPRPVWAVQDFFPPDYAARPWRMWQANDMRRIDGVAGAVNWDVVAP